MLVVRPFSILEDRVECGEVGRLRTQPGIDVFSLDWDDAAVVACCFHLGRWFIGDGGKREEIRLPGSRPLRPEARYHQQLTVVGAKLQDDVFAGRLRSVMRLK